MEAVLVKKNNMEQKIELTLEKIKVLLVQSRYREETKKDAEFHLSGYRAALRMLEDEMKALKAEEFHGLQTNTSTLLIP